MRFGRWRPVALGALLIGLNVPAWALIEVGKTSPAWTGKTVAGKTLTSAQLKGKVVLVNFFNNYCGPCLEEYPHLQAMHAKYGGKGFTVVSISNDETAAEAGNYAKKTKATFPVLHDPKGVVYNKFGVSPIPSNVVIDRKGKIVASIESANLPAIEAAVAKALSAK